MCPRNKGLLRAFGSNHYSSLGIGVRRLQLRSSPTYEFDAGTDHSFIVSVDDVTDKRNQDVPLPPQGLA